MILLTVALAGCTTGIKMDAANEKMAISEVVHNSIGWAKDKNKELLYQRLAQDARFFIYN
jgi:hypothetical protein